jgi:hypothetical protein
MPEFLPILRLANLDGRNGLQLSGASGASVASAGDVNGDGFADVIVSAGTNASYGLFGKKGGFASDIQLSSLNGTNGFRITCEANGNAANLVVASVGDVNGDGFDDMIVGAPNARTNGGYSGASYVVFGRNTSFPANFEVSSLNGSSGFQISGESETDFSGRSVASAGDINGDGFADVIIGAPEANLTPDSFEHNGASYVVFGGGRLPRKPAIVELEWRQWFPDRWRGGRQ